MKTKLFYLFSIVLSLLMYDCDDAEGGTFDSTPNASTFNSIQDLRNSLKPDPYVETVDPTGSFSVVGPDGTTITCTGNSLIDGNGSQVTDNVTISLYEFNTF